MITLNPETELMIRMEMNSIPEKYQKPFNSTHEGYAVLLEEVRELEHVVFFGEKEVKNEVKFNLSKEMMDKQVPILHKRRLREEAIQVAAMACRIIQELT